MSEVDAVEQSQGPAPTSTDAQDQSQGAAPAAQATNGNPLATITDKDLKEFVGRVEDVVQEVKKSGDNSYLKKVTPSPEELAAKKAVEDAIKAVEDANKALQTTPDDEAAKKALADAETKLAELKSKVGGRRRSTRRRHKKSGKKSRRQSKKGGKKHRKSTSKKGDKSKKRSQRKH